MIIYRTLCGYYIMTMETKDECESINKRYCANTSTVCINKHCKTICTYKGCTSFSSWQTHTAKLSKSPKPFFPLQHTASRGLQQPRDMSALWELLWCCLPQDPQPFRRLITISLKTPQALPRQTLTAWPRSHPKRSCDSSRFTTLLGAETLFLWVVHQMSETSQEHP